MFVQCIELVEKKIMFERFRDFVVGQIGGYIYILIVNVLQIKDRGKCLGNKIEMGDQ